MGVFDPIAIGLIAIGHLVCLGGRLSFETILKFTFTLRNMRTLQLAGLLAFILLMVMSCNNSPKNNAETVEAKTDSTIVTESSKGFSKTLELQGFTFDVRTTGEGSIQQLAIQPHGLKMDNSEIELEIDGSVNNAEIADLNADGFPEVLVYTVSAGSGSYGNVIGYSVNEGNSMSAISFPQVADNPKANKGYMGHDEFAIEASALIQRFKLYTESNNNTNPTGKTRRIQYSLKGDAGARKFVVDKITEY